MTEPLVMDYKSLNAKYARHHRRSFSEFERQEALLQDARAWAKTELKPTASEARDVLALTEQVVKKTWDEFVPKHPYFSVFRLGYSEFGAALLEEGYPSLEDHAVEALAELERSIAKAQSSNERQPGPSHPGRPLLQSEARGWTGATTHEPSWEDLAEAFKQVEQVSEPLRADWFAYEAREDFGIWL